MPYIKQEDRKHLQQKLNDLCGHIVELDVNPGVLNYIITYLCHWWLPDNPRYADINEVVGVLECVKSELYRQIAAPYEDEKKSENGSISELDDER